MTQSQQKTMGDLIDDFTSDWSVLAQEKCLPSPRFQVEVHTVLKELRAIKAVPEMDIQEAGEKLLQSRRQLETRWKALHENFTETARLFIHMRAFESWLRASLLHDYGGFKDNSAPFTWMRVAQLARLNGSHHQKATVAALIDIPIEQCGYFYEERVTNVLRELMLDARHVETKMAPFVAGHDMLTSNAQNFASTCRWSDLAQTLWKDKILAETLHERGKLPNHELTKIKSGLRRIQKKYFKELLSPERFELTAAAQRLSPPSRSSLPTYSELFG